MNREKKIEGILLDSLKMLEDGRSHTQILEAFPEYKKEIEEMFLAIEFLKKKKDKIMPEKDTVELLMQEIITKKEDGICNSLENSKKESLASFFNKLNTMEVNSKGAMVMITTLALIVIIYVQLNFKTTNQNFVFYKTNNQTTGEISIPAATGNIDDVVDALIKDSLNEQKVLENYDESLLINLDSKELINLGQTYDENQF